MKKITKIYILFFILFATLSANNSMAGKIFWEKLETDEYINNEIPIYDELDKKIYLDNFGEKTILLVFWAPWCSACVNELPLLDNLQKDFKKLPFQIIAISENSKSTEHIKKYYETSNIRHLDIFHDPQNILFKDLGISSLPTAYLIDKDGKIKLKIKGFIKWQDNAVRRLILDELGAQHEMPRNTYKKANLNRKLHDNFIILDKKEIKQEDTATDTKSNKSLKEQTNNKTEEVNNESKSK